MSEPTLEEKQLAALEQGKAYTLALSLMKQMDVHAEESVEDYIVTLAVEKAEGMFMVQPEGDLQWQIPADHDNAHLEIVVRDKKDLRFIPQLTVIISLKTLPGNVVLEQELPFLWHPFLYHYGSDVHIPEEGEYIPEVTIKQPQFGRHDENKGKRYEKTITITLPQIHIKPGRKEYGPE